MKNQIDPLFKSEIRIDFTHALGNGIAIEFAAQRPAMVPPEAPMPMRRQPTPLLIAPLRWSGWTFLTQCMTNLVRRSRYSLGYERD